MVRKFVTDNFTSLTFTFLVSLFLFRNGNPGVLLYLLVCGSIWAAIAIAFRCEKNAELYITAGFIALVNLIAFLIQKAFNGRTLSQCGWKFAFITIYLALVLWVITAAIQSCFNSKDEKDREDNKRGHVHLLTEFIYRDRDDRKIAGQPELPELFPERRADLERVEQYLHLARAIGVEGPWGSGKTILVNHLEREYTADRHTETSSEYIYAEIHLLSCDLDNIADVLLNTISSILLREHIFSRSLPRLRALLSDETWFRRLGFSFATDGTYTDAMDSLRTELEKLEGKRIVLVFEDIDRIQNADVIRKVFSICEDLSRSTSIQLIYEFDQSNLEKTDENFTRDYVEKYIPFIVTLTEIPARRLIETCLERKNSFASLEIRDFEFLLLPVQVNQYLAQIFHIDKAFTIQWRNLTVRKIENFLSELNLCVEEITEGKAEEWKEYQDRGQWGKTIVLFYALKHFCYDIYETLNTDEGLVDQLTLDDHGKQYSLWQLISLQERSRQQEQGKQTADPVNFHQLIQDEKNRFRFAILSLFGYEFHIQSIWHDARDMSKIDNEDVLNIITRNRNEKIDRLVWHLLSSGKSNHTNMQVFVNRMEREVLSAERGKQREAFSRLCSDYSRHIGFQTADNDTIFHIGMNRDLEVFQAYRGCLASASQWGRLVRFYIENENNHQLDTDYFEVYKYCDLESRDTYFLILKDFPERKAAGNPQNLYAYKIFLRRYIKQMSVFGFASASITEAVEFVVDQETPLDKDTLDDFLFVPLIASLDKLDSELADYQDIRDDIAVLKRFVRKNQELLKEVNPLQEKQMQINTTEESRYLHQEEIERITQIRREGGDWIREAKQAYKKENITPLELHMVLDHVDCGDRAGV